MKSQFKIEADGGLIVPIQPIHPKLKEELLQAGFAPGIYEMDIIKLPVDGFLDGVWIKKPGSQIIKIQ